MSTAAQALILAITAIVCAGQPIQSSYSEIRRLRAVEKQRPLSNADRKRLGLAYYAAGQHLLFRRVMAEAASADPRDPEPDFYLGRHYASDVSDYAKAAAHFRAAASLDPSAVHQAYLGHALEMQGSTAEALALYRQAAAASPCETVSLAGRLRLGGIGSEPAIACKPEHPVVLREVAKVLSTEGKHAEAARLLERILALEPANVPVAYQLHRAWRAAGDLARAEAALAAFKRASAVYGSR